MGARPWTWRKAPLLPCLLVLFFEEQPPRRKKVPQCFIHASKKGLCSDRIRQLPRGVYSRTGGNKATQKFLLLLLFLVLVPDSFSDVERKVFFCSELER